jgi:hypothetical protein
LPLLPHRPGVSPGAAMWRAASDRRSGGLCPAGKHTEKGVILLSFWQKLVWLGAAVVIVVSMLVLTQNAETSSATAPTVSQPVYFTFQDSGRSEMHYAVRDGDRAVVYNSMPAGR